MFHKRNIAATNYIIPQVELLGKQQTLKNLLLRPDPLLVLHDVRVFGQLVVGFVHLTFDWANVGVEEGAALAAVKTIFHRRLPHKDFCNSFGISEPILQGGVVRPAYLSLVSMCYIVGIGLVVVGLAN